MLDSSLGLHPQVALRPEPFGALAYHFHTRKLVFLKHPDVVRVVRSLADHATVADALVACEIDERRWPSFDKAITSLYESDMLCESTELEASGVADTTAESPTGTVR
ncbi:MAG: mycofactocin biosynthesis chaperone MftB [Ilumatobacter sp.]|uniref:mycofactocin biosynthesis chaperone MftB n=1 Tax=Ilumatobacter sp. TaxID=1967498 RepID=UPI00329A13B6